MENNVTKLKGGVVRYQWRAHLPSNATNDHTTLSRGIIRIINEDMSRRFAVYKIRWAMKHERVLIYMYIPQIPCIVYSIKPPERG